MTQTITPVDYATDNLLAAMADQIMAKAGVDKNDVAEIIVGDTTATLTVYLRDDSGTIKLRNRDHIAQTQIEVVWP